MILLLNLFSSTYKRNYQQSFPIQLSMTLCMCMCLCVTLRRCFHRRRDDLLQRPRRRFARVRAECFRFKRDFYQLSGRRSRGMGVVRERWQKLNTYMKSCFYILSPDSVVLCRGAAS